ncbi:hypothetical protein NHH03_01720 [Stieleria sp. TO1_6]|uniref:hypothetical protein n=1 Tax=Stieleria tagensis TaxID=2956795 RepID=UPI00209A9F00|nr:hypothetical protein [Stieleria tagensis]MCO8120438.1 hypothetical protein [Stieleria tagensis]
MPDDPPNPFARPQSSAPDPAFNPYAPSAHVSESDGTKSDAEAFRHQYLAHEAGIKSIGIFYFLAGAMMSFVSLAMLGQIAMVAQDGGVVWPLILGLIIFAAIAILLLYASWGIRRFEYPAKIIVTIFSTLGLIGIPLGTIINGYILYLLYSQIGQTVFSPQYQDVIRQTPHIRYKTSIIVKIFVGILLFVVTLGMIALLFGA